MLERNDGQLGSMASVVFRLVFELYGQFFRLVTRTNATFKDDRSSKPTGKFNFFLTGKMQHWLPSFKLKAVVFDLDKLLIDNNAFIAIRVNMNYICVHAAKKKNLRLIVPLVYNGRCCLAGLVTE